MDPAASAPSQEFREEVIDSVSRLVNLWLEHEEEELHHAVEARLQQLMSAHCWLLDSLHPLAQDFILNELHLHPLAATASQPSPAVKILPGPPEVLPGRKRRSRRRRVAPQLENRTSELAAVVSGRDALSVSPVHMTVYTGAVFVESAAQPVARLASQQSLTQSATHSSPPSQSQSDPVDTMLQSIAQSIAQLARESSALSVQPATLPQLLLLCYL
ncbi:uncharacterized protein LOC113032202 [Astatotilapia calliptera]|uniref:uncharacterized protein LOC113032202 n=1 Tax=Astatotilapia calliptera TaxID=8154 RepID=UPI000E41C214|nr:uncharacterized protein LOC113032202 [Astatotilapia calliptera]